MIYTIVQTAVRRFRLRRETRRRRCARCGRRARRKSTVRMAVYGPNTSKSRNSLYRVQSVCCCGAPEEFRYLRRRVFAKNMFQTAAKVDPSPYNGVPYIAPAQNGAAYVNMGTSGDQKSFSVGICGVGEVFSCLYRYAPLWSLSSSRRTDSAPRPFLCHVASCLRHAPSLQQEDGWTAPTAA